MTEMTGIVPALVDAGAGFELDDLRVREGDIVVSLRRKTDDGRVELVVGAQDAPGAVWRGARCAVRYSTRLASVSPAEREELRALIHTFGAATERWLIAHPDASAGDLPKAFSLGTERIAFTPEGALELLGLRLDASLPGGWRLAGIYPSSMISESEAAHLSLVLELAHPSDGTLRVELGARNDAARAFARSAHLDLSYLTLGSSPPASVAPAMRLLGLLLRLRDTDEVEIEFVSATSAAPLLPPSSAPLALAPGAPKSAEWLNLAVNTPCAQACQFCSVLEVSPAWTKDLRFERLLLDLRSNAAAGVRRVRLNGYDPLTHPRVLELAHAVRQLGYAEVMVFSPCTTLADVDFLDALLEALPPAPSFHVPVYGPTAEVHDRVVGRAGAFERVARALELLGERLPREHLVITSVAVKDNLAHLLELRRWALERAIRFHVQTPYPSSESPSDRYHTSAARFRDIAAETLRAGCESVIVNGVPPCVYFERGEALGIEPKSWLTDEQRPLPGREYVGGAFSHRALVVQHSVSVPPAVACPHERECALATACPREVLRSYADLHGLDELTPVRLRSLLR